MDLIPKSPNTLFKDNVVLPNPSSGDTALSQPVRTATGHEDANIHRVHNDDPHVIVHHVSPQLDESGIFQEADGLNAVEQSTDLLNKIPSMYRLLDLVNDGADKIIIHEDSIKKFVNKVQPGSYVSQTKIDFKSLDSSVISPFGIYGSRSKILQWLEEQKVISADLTARLRGDPGTVPAQLRPGLYLVDIEYSMEFIVFWPEETTWEAKDTTSVGKNRVAFMRYLTKLCDQVACLVSDEDGANIASQMKWGEEAFRRPFRQPGRLFSFKVKESAEHEESAIAMQSQTVPLQEVLKRMTNPELTKKYPPRLIRGNVMQGILLTYFQEAKVIPHEKSVKREMHLTRLRSLLRGTTGEGVRLDPNIDGKCLELLLDAGLDQRFSSLYTKYLEKVEINKQATIAQRREQLQDWEKRRIYLLPNIRRAVARQVLQAVIKSYPLLQMDESGSTLSFGIEESSKSLQTLDQSDVNSIPDTKDDYPLPQSNTLEKALNSNHINQLVLNLPLDEPGDFTRLKRAWLIIDHSVDIDLLNIEQQVQFCDVMMDGASEERINTLLQTWPPSASPPETNTKEPTRIQRWKYKVKNALRDNMLTSLWFSNAEEDSLSDAGFLQSLNSSPDGLMPIVQRIQQEALKIIQQWWTKYITELVQMVLSTQKKDLEQKMDAKDRECKEVERMSFVLLLNTELEKEFHPDVWCINHTSINEYGSCVVEYNAWEAYEAKRVYTVNSLMGPELNESKLVRQLEPHADYEIKHIQFIQAKELLVIYSTNSLLTVYLISISGGSRLPRPFKIQLERFDSPPCAAVDEVKRQLAIVGTCNGELKLFIHPFSDGLFSSHTPVILKGWPFGGTPSIECVEFVQGKNMLAMLDSTGQMAMLSLSTQQFRPAGIDLKSQPVYFQSTPEGSCLLVGFDIPHSLMELRVFHIESFGCNPDGIGISNQPIRRGSQLSMVALDNGTGPLLSALDTSTLTLTTTLLKITSSSSEYSFQTSSNHESHPDTPSKHLLLHCFTELWNRYPIVPVIERYRERSSRQTHALQFVVSANHGSFVKAFTSQITEFVSSNVKPTSGRLSSMRVIATSSLDLETSISTFQTGDWLVGLFCLIPIQIAMAQSNNFRPMKDGCRSPFFEDSILGANVEQVANVLSFGWYESIFSSYLAKKPVRVVSSMGEQSVGKSYALNHLSDTTFAGSAMRCTEGVWLSVTPCAEELIVSMDFEGIQSVERTQQEDVLMVLFQTAISNMVLFRHHSAVTRALADLFHSFQNSARILDPKTNPELFHSLLTIVIKDVDDNDADGVVREFETKLGSIVSDEKGGNFITKLHRGELVVMPWATINSAVFYSLFEDVRDLLLARRLTHRTGGEFLLTLKMLMAKIQACDWSALDKNLALQRSNFLLSSIDNALKFGRTGHDSGPLTVLDTDDVIPHDTFQDFILSLPCLGPPEGSPLVTLQDLAREWRIDPKCQGSNEETEASCWSNLFSYLNDLVENRIKLVGSWIIANTSRFTESHDIQQLRATFDTRIKLIRSQVALCPMLCTTCRRRCIDFQNHTSPHNCGTDHKCSHNCNFPQDHSEEPPHCAQEALHSGVHLCDKQIHLCDKPCSLSTKGNCLKRCSREPGHSDTEHRCRATIHTCGQPCDLSSSKLWDSGKPVCGGTCVLDCLFPHDLHCCEKINACPFQCALCSRLCAVPDHFHGMIDGVFHICGDEHRCNQKCELPGMCDIQPKPRSVQVLFSGKHEIFQYTQYNQVARRLPCMIRIPPGQLEHEGIHNHGNDHHTCEATCPDCEYYCDLPLGHTQQGHRTSHGSMKKTRWYSEEDGDVVVGGHRYATGDSGAPMLCSLVCAHLGRHVHLADCKGIDGQCPGGTDIEHVKRTEGPSNRDNALDWVTHRLHWECSGFADPYSEAEKATFEKCDYLCTGDEHRTDIPSYCVLPIFHDPALQSQLLPGCYISPNGHMYQCPDPSSPACHIIFVIDRSTSMTRKDHVPNQYYPGHEYIKSRHDNRYGAVLGAVSRFLDARQATRSHLARDAHSCILFSGHAMVAFKNDVATSPRHLVKILANQPIDRGTKFGNALRSAKTVMNEGWDIQRPTVIIFLSDGEGLLDESDIRDLCNSAVELGKPLAFYSVAFGKAFRSGRLRTMSKIAHDIYRVARPQAKTIPCGYSGALDTVSLENAFLDIAESLRRDRATLVLK